MISIFLHKQAAPKTGESCGAENEFGPCDAGSICSASGTCDSIYKESTAVCLAAQGCCDTTEYCTGSSYTCSKDVTSCVDDIKSAASVVVDGETYDWDLNTDFYKLMTNAGERDSTLRRYTEVAKAYIKYDCVTSTLCVLALADDGYFFAPVGAATWVKDYDIGTSILPPLAITDVYKSDEIVGWEGCFTVAQGCHDNLEIHANWGESPGATGNSASTGSPELDPANVISLSLHCTAPPPPNNRFQKCV